jgi:hypothetical protein
MEDRQFTFEQIVGSEARMVSVDAEDFADTESYRWLWQQMKQLPGVNFDFESWQDVTDDDNDPKMDVVVDGVTRRIELANNMASFDFNFIEKLNEIIEALSLSENRFRNVSPEGVENNYGSLNIVFLPKDIVNKLDENGYGLGDAKWFGL